MSPATRWLLRESLRTRFAIFVLFIVAWAVYHPAFNRVFVWDQIWYFAELDGRTSLLDGLRHYDYAATRRFWKGDDALFRPLLFTWLAVGNSLFSYHHEWWNIANAALHALVAIALFRLLTVIRPSPFALPVAVLFLVLKPPMELVLWNHLGGYLLAALFMTIGLRVFVRLTFDGGAQSTRRDSIVYVLAFSAAALCHDAMVAAALVAGLLLLWATRPTPPRATLALVPVALYVSLYYFHAQRVERLSYVDRPDTQDLLAFGNMIRVVPRTLCVLGAWTRDFMLPSAVTLNNAAFDRFGKSVAFSWSSPLHLANVLLAIAVIGGIGVSTSRAHVRRVAPVLVFLVGTALAYAAVLCLGRAPEELFGVTYYLYFFGLLLTMFGYSLIDFARLRAWKAAGAWIVVLALIALNWTETSAMTRDVERANHYPSSYLTRVIRFVDAHKSEPDFSFALLPHPETLDPVIALREGYPDDPRPITRNRRMTQILFRKYYKEEKPQDVLDAGAFGVVSP